MEEAGTGTGARAGVGVTLAGARSGAKIEMTARAAAFGALSFVASAKWTEFGGALIGPFPWAYYNTERVNRHRRPRT